MAEPNRPRSFRRNLSIDPYKIAMHLNGAPVPTPVGRERLRSAGITSFVMQNPNLFWVWYRGWTGDEGDMPTPFMKGHLIAPGGEHLRESQTPDWIVAVPWARPGWPLVKDGQPIQSDAESMLIYTLGSGGL